MAFTHKMGKTYTTDSGTVASVTSSYTADGEVGYQGLVNAGTNNAEIDLAFTQANVKSCVLYADKALTLKTNSTSAPQETIALAAKQMVEWNIDHTDACPFAGNVTKFYATNASLTDNATLTIKVLVDLTP